MSLKQLGHVKGGDDLREQGRVIERQRRADGVAPPGSGVGQLPGLGERADQA